MSCISASTFEAKLRFISATAILLMGCGAPSHEVHEGPGRETPLVEVADAAVIPEVIAAAMETQVIAWNEGDIDAFMSAGYLQDDRLLFVGSRGLTYGYDVVLENYRNAYPDGAARGVLAFENLEWVPLGSRHGLVVGKWTIERAEGDLSGHYSLVWELGSEGWRIIADHSS